MTTERDAVRNDAARCGQNNNGERYGLNDDGERSGQNEDGERYGQGDDMGDVETLHDCPLMQWSRMKGAPKYCVALMYGLQSCSSTDLSCEKLTSVD
jgi:hypothetical protein